MAQEAETKPAEGQEPTAETEPKEGQEPQGEQSETFSRDYVEQLRQEAASRRTKASELEAELEEYRERDKTETEKLAGQRDKFKTEAETTKAENLRLRVALDKGLTGDKADLIDRLRGTTQEELEVDAEKLLALVKSPNNNTETDFDGGAREPAPEPVSPDKAHGKFLVDMFRGNAPT